MIEARDLTKRYGDKLAVDHLSFTVEPGRVTGFLGPNGAGKSTTMRLILGLDRPHSGRATINGKRYADIAQPLRTGGFSLGMSQRVGIAVALLGDPEILILDEPVNGLDPEGILWIRNLMKQLASEGRTVFVSSHLMNEMAVTADHLIVIGRGKLLAETSTQDFIERSSEKYVLVRSPDAATLADLIAADGGKAEPEKTAGGQAPALRVSNLDAPRIGQIAAADNIVLHELTPRLASLE